MKQQPCPRWEPVAAAGPSPAETRQSGTRPRAAEEEIPCTSFEEVYRRHSRLVMDGIVGRLTSDASFTLRDDIFQEVFAKAGRRFRERRGIPHPVTVLLLDLVASEVRIQTRRQAQARRRFDGEPDEETTPASRPDPEQLCALYEAEAGRRQLVAATFHAMRPEAAAVIQQVDIEERSYEEAAQELGYSVPVFTARLYRAREQFCKLVRELRRRR